MIRVLAIGRLRRASKVVLAAYGLFIILLGAVALWPGKVPGVSAQAQTKAVAANHPVTLSVLSARNPTLPFRTETPVGKFQYLIVKDDTGNPTAACNTASPGYPENCDRPGVHAVRGGTAAVALNPDGSLDLNNTQVVTQGDQNDFASTACPPNAGPALALPPGKYVVSVTAPGTGCGGTPVHDSAGNTVDGFKIDGAHFTVEANGNVVQSTTPPGITNAPGTVTVEMTPTPLPLSTIRVQVFHDVNGVNGEFDVPAEDGLPGFVGHIHDVLDEVTTDWYGKPLCTIYQKAAGNTNPDPFVGPYATDSNGDPIIKQLGGQCVSDSTGLIEIGNLGPNRYSVQVTPPPGDGPNYWQQTSTLEGAHDWDTWPQEGATGFDSEVLLGGEPAAEVRFGFVHAIDPHTNPVAGTPAWSNGIDATHGELKGQVNGIRAYTPPAGGLTFGGEAGNALDPPCANCWIALGNLQAGDTTTYIAPVNPDGSFDITGIPCGDYETTVWDKNQDFLIETNQATVYGNASNPACPSGGPANGVTDMGVYYLAHWFAIYHGSVFVDSNGNGKRDPGEKGVPNQAVQLLSRDNSLQDQGIAAVTTDQNGDWLIREAYPLGQMVVNQVYNQSYKTTGVTYQTDNQPTETTVLGAGVDLSVEGFVGLSTRIDWGVQPYAAGENGGIVSTVYYATTRNELDARLAATESYEAGISGLTVDLYAPVPDDTQPDGWARNSDGSYVLGPLLSQYTSEQYHRAQDCIARGFQGVNLSQPPVAAFLPQLPTGPGGPHHDCLDSAFVYSNQVGTGPLDGDPSSPTYGQQTLGTEVNGNYGFGDMCTPPTDANGNYLLVDASNPSAGYQSTWDPVTGACTSAAADAGSLAPSDYLVRVEIPNDPRTGKPMLTPEREEDVNIATGDSFAPQAPPPPCAGSYHTVDVAGQGTDNYPITTSPDGFTVPASTPVGNPAFVGIGGSPYEGQAKPLCDVRLITLQDRHSISTGTFNFFTPVPVPGRFRTLVTDDLTLSTDPTDLNYGEKLGIPNMPVGLYDWTGRLQFTGQTDASGVAEMIMPSTDTYNCPLPAGPCPNVYRFVANDPGSPDHPNVNHNPAYRTLAAGFQLWPNLTLGADLAPVPISSLVEGPGQQGVHPAECKLPGEDPAQTLPSGVQRTPQIYAVDKPYVTGPLLSGPPASNPTRVVTINGLNFGSTRGSVTLDGTPVAAVNIISWFDTQIVVRIPGGFGPHRLGVTRADATATGGGSTVNGLMIHVTGGGSAGYNPSLLEVGPGHPSSTHTATTTAGSTTVTGVSAGTSGLGVGMSVTGSGIPADTTIDAVLSGSSIRLSAAATTTGAQSLTFTYLVIQSALNFARDHTRTTGSLPRSLQWLVVVYPSSTGQFNPLGAYYENLVVNSPVKLQGVGPGGVYPAGTALRPGQSQNTLGSIVDGSGFATLSSYPLPAPAGTTPDTNPDVNYAQGWRDLVGSLTWTGNQQVYEGAVISVFARENGGGSGDPLRFRSSYQAAIDGFGIQGGDQLDTPGNLNDNGGGPVPNPVGDAQVEAAVAQGGGIFVNAYAHSLQITNDVLKANGGSYGGAIRLGTPNIGSNNNDNINIGYDRILNNGGSNLAGAIGIFTGANAYEIHHNDVCGNFSAEYGGGISHFGLSTSQSGVTPSIHDNKIYFNGSYDEGAGIMIAGELPANPANLSAGSGLVNIYNNVIQHNIASDDGGGLRFLQAGNFRINVFNNVIANNVSTHEGGGVAFDDATNVSFYNNTVVKNITTATARTSNGQPAPAGLSDTGNSIQLQNTLPASHSHYSDPQMFNNIFWDNRAGAYNGLTNAKVTGIGLAGDATPINYWDMGTADGAGPLHPFYSIISDTSHSGSSYLPSGTNKNVSPASNSVGLVNPTNTQIDVLPWAGDPHFVGTLTIALTVPPLLEANYHLAGGTNQAVNAATPCFPHNSGCPVTGANATLRAPLFDIDNQGRPFPAGTPFPTTGFNNNFDMGADERQ